MNTKFLAVIISLSAISSLAFARESNTAGTEANLASQNTNLSANTNGKGYGPQSPRDLGSKMVLTNAFLTPHQLTKT